MSKATDNNTIGSDPEPDLKGVTILQVLPAMGAGGMAV